MTTNSARMVIGLTLAVTLLTWGGEPVAQAAQRSSPARSTVVQHASGLPWSSGVAPENGLGKNVNRFARQRRAAVDNIVVFPGKQSWVTLLSTYWYAALPGSFQPQRDDLVMTLPLWPSSNSVRDTGTHDEWVILGQHIASQDPNAYVRLGWEMNIHAYWELNAGNRTQWIQQFRRAVRLIKVDCPRCRIVWNPNRGPDQTGTSSRSAFIKLKSIIDVYAIDSYDIYPSITSAQDRWDQLYKKGGLQESYAFARKYHKPFALPEWGIACRWKKCLWGDQAGGDNPMYIDTYMKWFADHAQHLAFESYLDSPASTVRSALFTNPIGPKAGAAYRRDLRAMR